VEEGGRVAARPLIRQSNYQPGVEIGLWNKENTQSINQPNILTEPHTGKEKADPSTTTGGSKPCVYLTGEVGCPLHDFVITYIVWCVTYKRELGGESYPLPNNRAIVLHQGGQCRWAGGIQEWLIRVEQPRSKHISCKGQEVGRGGGGALG